MIGKLGDYRVVDLTKKIVPGQMGRRCEVRLNHSERTDDYNCDVDIMDVMMIASRWNSRVGDELNDQPYDFDTDGDMDVDVMTVATRWGPTC